MGTKSKKAKAKPKAKAKAKPKAKVNAKAKAKPSPKAKVVTKPTKMSAKLSSTILPLADRLLIRVEGVAEKTAGGIIIPGTVEDRPNRGEVIAKGGGRRNKKGLIKPLDVSVGDRVLFQKYAGSALTLDGQEFLILREEEVLGIVTESLLHR